MHFLPEQNFDCSQCTKCCRGWRISIDPSTQAKLQGHSLGQSTLDQRDQKFYARKTNEGACVFLSSDNLCSIHSQLGADHKPRGCRQFPFRLCRTPDGIFVGLSFYCSAAQSNQGRPLPAHAAELEELAAELPLIGDRPLPVQGRHHLKWSDYRTLDEFLMRELQQGPVEMALGRALWGLCQSIGGGRGLAHYLKLSEAALLPPEEPFILMEQHFFALLVAHCEAPTAHREPFRRALQSHRPVSFERFAGWRGSLAQLRVRLGPQGDHQLRRYLKALVFRKYLVARRTLLSNLAMLYLVPPLFSFWAALSQHSRNAPQPEEVDFFRALDECESKIITHPNDLDPIYQQVAEGFLDQIDFV